MNDPHDPDGETLRQGQARIEPDPGLSEFAAAEALEDVLPVPRTGTPMMVGIGGSASAAQEPAASALPAFARAPEGDSAVRLSRQSDDLNWHLRDVTERGEVSTQELKANNEELQAINEELTTVNHALKSHVDALGRTNADLRNLMTATAIATVFLDRQLRIRLYTPSAETIFNLIGTDVGRPLSDLVSRLDYPQMGDDARHVLAELAPIEREVHAGDKAYLARALPHRDSEDRIAGVVFTFLDVTARKGDSDALRESEAKLRAIVGQAAAGVAHLDLAGRLTFVSPRYGEIHGTPERELIGMPMLDLVHPADRDRERVAFSRLVAEGLPFEMEKRHLRHDGSLVWVSAAVAPMVDEVGHPKAVIAILLDITARKQADQALRKSEERLRLLLENAREYAIVAMELDRTVTSWNRGAERLLGFAEKEILGRSADVIFTKEDRVAGAPSREAAVALAEGRAVDERWLRRKDGSRFWGSGMMMAMHGGEANEIVGLLKIFRDETVMQVAQVALETSRAELVQALVENRRARAEAEAASQAKDRFLAILSHELRTPMTPVVMALHALDRSTDLPASARSTLAVIMRNVKAELRLIDDLLDVTRISSGKFELLQEPVDMHQVIRAAADICEADLASRSQRLRLLLGAPRSMVSGDAQRLQQVVWNLLKNAAKFSPAEGDIRIETRNVDGFFAFQIVDNGIGIDPAALPTIFDEFAQEGPWITTEFGGLGLGLAIAKATVDAHHGTLVAESEGRDRGASFTVELPLA